MRGEEEKKGDRLSVRMFVYSCRFVEISVVFCSLSPSLFSSAADTYHVASNSDDDDGIFYKFVVDICRFVHNDPEENREKFEKNRH